MSKCERDSTPYLVSLPYPDPRPIGGVRAPARVGVPI